MQEPSTHKLVADHPTTGHGHWRFRGRGMNQTIEALRAELRGRTVSLLGEVARMIQKPSCGWFQKAVEPALGIDTDLTCRNVQDLAIAAASWPPAWVPCTCLDGLAVASGEPRDGSGPSASSNKPMPFVGPKPLQERNVCYRRADCSQVARETRALHSNEQFRHL